MSMRSPTQTQAKSSFTPVEAGVLQRKCASCGQHTLAGGECAECQKKRSPLQRRSTNQAEPSEVPSIVHEVLRSPGQSLDANTRTFMESRFGQDFSQVRVHTDTHAAASAQAVNALAYTVGNNVVFGAGQYPSKTHSGQLLMAHELTHVVQQSARSPALATKLTAIAEPADSAEQEADAVANQVVSGSGVSHSINPHPVAIQKKEPNEVKDQEQITPSSGLKSTKEFATLLAMCDIGNLDLLGCRQMRRKLQQLPQQINVGSYSLLNLGLEVGKEEEQKLPSPNEAKEQEQFTLSSGLKIKEEFATLLAMCDIGNLDPLRCHRMRRKLQQLPQQINVGSYSLLNSGLEVGKEEEQFTLSSGLKINKEEFATMLAMCDTGKLDPLRCREMRRELRRLPKERGSGIYPRFNLGLEVGKRDERMKKLLEINSHPGLRPQIIMPLSGWQKEFFSESESDPPLGMEGPRSLPKLKLPAATPAPSSAPSSQSLGSLDISFVKKMLEPELDLHIGKLKLTIPNSAEMKFAPIPLKRVGKLQISAKGEITNLKELVEKDPTKHGPPVSLSLTVALNDRPNIKIDATSTVDLNENTITTGISFTLFDSSCHFKVPYSTIDKINSAVKELKKYSDSAWAEPENQPPNEPPTPPSKPLDIVADVAPHIVALFEAIKEIEDAKKKCQQGARVKFEPSMIWSVGKDEPDFTINMGVMF